MLTKAERPEKNDLLKEQKVKRMTSKRKSPVMAYKHKGGKKKESLRPPLQLHAQQSATSNSYSQKETLQCYERKHNFPH